MMAAHCLPKNSGECMVHLLVRKAGCRMGDKYGVLAAQMLTVGVGDVSAQKRQQSIGGYYIVYCCKEPGPGVIGQ